AVRDALHLRVEGQGSRNGAVAEQGVRGPFIDVHAHEAGKQAQVVGKDGAVTGPRVAKLLRAGRRDGDANLGAGERRSQGRRVGVAVESRAVGDKRARDDL